MAVERGAKSWRMAVSPTEDFTHVVVDSEQWGMGKIITREQFRNILGVDSSTPGLIKAGTESAPVVLEPREQPGLYIAKGSPGYYSWDGIVEEAQSGFDWYLVWNDDSESWSLVDMGELPQAENKILDWEAGTYVEGDQRIHNGQIWSVDVASTTEEPGTGEDWKPDTIAGAEVVDNLTTPDADKTLSANQGTVIQPRILPPDKIFPNIDRPDIDAVLIEVDKDLRIISILSEQEPLQIKTINNFDRPDVPLAIVDNDLKVILSSFNNRPDPIPGSSDLSLPLWNPPEQTGFDIPVSGDDSILGSYSALTSVYDAFLTEYNNPNIESYITKSSIGESKLNNIPIWMYSFRPIEPEIKVLLVAGTHANEKMYIWVLRYFFEELLSNWGSNQFLEYIRWNVQIDVLPCRSPYTISNDVRKRGFRVIPETEPIPFSWVKSGTTVTLTFDVADFPDDGFLSGADYFTAMPSSALVNKSSFGVITSSDETAVPLNGYRIRGVISGNSITFTAPAGGASSGTGTFQVWADPNRNAAIEGTTFWEDYTGSTSIQPNDAGNVVGFHDAKGTRPFSLLENRNLFDLISEESYDYVMDCHSPSNDNYLDYDPTTGFMPDISKILSESGAFVSTDSRISDLTNVTTPYPTIAVTRDYGVPMHTVEWGDGLYDANGENVRNAMRWMGIVLRESILKIKNKK